MNRASATDSRRSRRGAYPLADVVALPGALVIAACDEQTNAVFTAVLLLLFSRALTATACRQAPQIFRGAERRSLSWRGADARLVRSPRMLIETLAVQLGIVRLDAATVTLVRMGK
jgi:hypothetical protein